MVFVQDEDTGLFKIEVSRGYEDFPERQQFLKVVQLLLSGEVVESLRLNGGSLVHTACKPNTIVAKLTNSLFMQESLFELFGGDIEVPYGLIVVGNRADSKAPNIDGSISQICLSNLFSYLSNSINNILFYQAWNTERTRLEDNILLRTQQLRTEKENFEAIYNTSMDGIAVLDVHTSAFLEANPAYEAMTGFTLEELRRTSCLALSVPEDYERSMEVMHQVIETRSVTDFVKSCYVKGQRRITVNMSMALMQDKNRVLVTAKDVSERILLEQQLLQAKFESEEAARVKSDFLAKMSHEIRTPMTGVMGLAELALRQTEDPSQKGYLQKINQSAQSLLEIIGAAKF